MTRLPTHAIVRRGIGYVPEDRDVFAGLSVDENLRLAERGPKRALRPRVRALPGAEGARRTEGRHALGRPAADGRDRAGAPERQSRAARRRADQGAGAAARDRCRGGARAGRRADDGAARRAEPRRRRARGAAGRRARHGGRSCTRGRRPSCSATRSRCARSSACTEARIEHLRAPDHHRPRPRRDVLPDRLRALADLRPDGRPQLRARRVDHRRRVRDVVDVDADRRRRRDEAARRLPSSDSRSARCSRR